MKIRVLKGLTIGEVSLVDDGANPAARVTMMKAAAFAIPGIAVIRKSLADGHGDEAVQAFDGAMAGAAEPITALIAKGSDDINATLGRAAHALGESVAQIFAGSEPNEVASLLKQTGAQFAAMVTDEAVSKGWPKKKAEPDAKGDGDEDDGADPGEMAKPGDKAMQSKKTAPMKKSSEPVDPIEAIAAMSEAVSKAAASFGDIHGDAKMRDAVRQAIYSLQDSCNSILNDNAVKKPGDMILKSVGEFEDHLKQLLEVSKGANPAARARGVLQDNGNKTMNQESGDAAVMKSLQSDVVDLRGQLEAITKGRQVEESVIKARAMLPHGGPVELLAKALHGATPEQATAIETVLKALGAQTTAAALFRALGNVNPGGSTEAGAVQKSALLADAERIAASAVTKGRRHA